MLFKPALIAFTALIGLTVAAPASQDLSIRAGDHSGSSSKYGVGAEGYKYVSKASRKLNIVLTNDDSWASSNIRATYYALQTAGHKVVMVAPAHAQSGKGGTAVLPVNSTLVTPGAYGALPADAPFYGKNETDGNLNYFDGTPITTSFWALDFVKPFGGKIDLIVSGPNEGNNLGSFLYTLSGTLGASYGAVERGVPAMAFSANSSARSYLTGNWEPSNVSDTSNIIGSAVANWVTAYADQVPKGKRILPDALGLSINFATLTTKCVKGPAWKHTRFTGGAIIDELYLNSTSGLPAYRDLVPKKGLNTCRSGDCSLQGETDYLSEGDCRASVTAYSVDYDAPDSSTKKVNANLKAALKKINK